MDKKQKDRPDFKIGDIVTCIGYPINQYEWNERLIIGDDYVIEDIDFHFPGKICVKFNTEYYSNSSFVPEEFFDKKKWLRNKKLEEILKK
jgi:hypothetical protein